MKHKLMFSSLLLLALAPAAYASTTWYVNGVIGNDSNNCQSPLTACKTISHAISLAASGDSIMVAATTTYGENLTISKSLNIIGSSAQTTIIDGGSVNTVVAISNSAAQVTLSNLTIRHGHARNGGGIYNSGTLTINYCVISGNSANPTSGSPQGGGIYSAGSLSINNSTISGNVANGQTFGGQGGGIYSAAVLTINNSTISGNNSISNVYPHFFASGGGIYTRATLTINNSTISKNSVNYSGLGGGIYTRAYLSINNSTISGNSASYEGVGIFANYGSPILQNSIVANSIGGGNCYGTMTSHGYNMSSDGSCNFSNSGDWNNTNPMLGTLGNYGGPTQTIPLLSGSPAIDSGNPSGCIDGQGHLLKTDQRGMPRPDKEDTGGCDMGAYEKQSD